jgi:hypothetical protein
MTTHTPQNALLHPATTHGMLRRIISEIENGTPCQLTLEHARIAIETDKTAQELLAALRGLMNQAAKDAEGYAPDGSEPIWAWIADASDIIAKAEGKA